MEKKTISQNTKVGNLTSIMKIITIAEGNQQASQYEFDIDLALPGFGFNRQSNSFVLRIPAGEDETECVKQAISELESRISFSKLDVLFDNTVSTKDGTRYEIDISVPLKLSLLALRTNKYTLERTDSVEEHAQDVLNSYLKLITLIDLILDKTEISNYLSAKDILSQLKEDMVRNGSLDFHAKLTTYLSNLIDNTRKNRTSNIGVDFYNLRTLKNTIVNQICEIRPVTKEELQTTASQEPGR